MSLSSNVQFFVILFIVTILSKPLSAQPQVVRQTGLTKEYETKTIPLATKLFGPGYGATLYALDVKDTLHYYVHFFLEHASSKKSWKNFEFQSNDTIIFVQDNGAKMIFTDLDTANSHNEFFGGGYSYRAPRNNHSMPSGTSIATNSFSVVDFRTSFEISKTQLDYLTTNKLKKIIVRTTEHKIKSRGNGNRLAKRIPLFYLQIEEKQKAMH